MMGAELARAVSAHFASLDGSAFKVLTRMAWTALDRPNGGRPACLYWAGWEPLALALGWQLPADDDKSEAARRRRKKLQDYVARALQKCADAGAFERLEDQPRMGTRQTYRLTLQPMPAPHSEGGTSTPLGGVQKPPLSGVHQHPSEGGTSTPLGGVPRNKQEEHEDLSKESTTRQAAQTQVGARGSHSFEDDEFGVGCGSCPMPAEHPVHQRHSVVSTGVAVVGTVVSTASNAGALVDEWRDYCEQPSPSRVVDQVTHQVRTLLAEGIDLERVRAALAEWNRKGLHPNTLPSVVHEISNCNRKPSGQLATDDLFARAAVRMGVIGGTGEGWRPAGDRR